VRLALGRGVRDYVGGYGSRSGVAVGVFCVVRIQGKVLTIGILNAWYKYRGRGVETKETDSET